MRTPWTLSAIEAAIFLALVLVLAGAGTWASTIGWRTLPAAGHPVASARL
jgi:hypothetical protein